MVRDSTKAEPAPDTHAREADITGKPPRIPPLNLKEFSKETIESANAMYKAAGMPATGMVTEYMATMLRHPALYERHTGLALQFFAGALGLRDRELVILRISWLCQTPYEWGEHVTLGKRLAGMTTAEIEDVIQGSSASGWNAHERALLRAVEELYDDAMISDGTWAVLARSLDEKQLIELPLLVGQIQGVAYLLNALRLRLIPGNPGLSAR